MYIKFEFKKKITYRIFSMSIFKKIKNYEIRIKRCKNISLQN